MLGTDGSLSNLIDDIAGSVVPEAAAVEKPVTPKKAVKVEAPPPADDADGAELDEEAPEEVESEEEMEDESPEPVELPEGMVAVPTITDKLVTEFVLRDTDGEEVETPSLTIEYKANGKIRKDRIDQVVKLAQFGVYNQERERAFQAQQEEAEQVVQETVSQLELREQQIRQLLENEEAYFRIREQYLAENEPEKRAQRAESEAQELRTQQQLERQTRQAEQFYHQTVMTGVQELAEKFPEVELDEITAQLGSALVPIMRNNIVPPAMYPQVEAYIASTLAEWVESKHNARAARYSGEIAKAGKEVEAAKIAAAKAKRSAASAARPAVRSSSGGSKKSNSSLPTTLRDAEASAMEAILSGITR